MNVHHLELFYYVARYGGISEAVRNIPYGIQQPAVSGQVLQLEEYLGVTLFHRRPFSLTPEGEKLFRFIDPFFSKLDLVATELQGRSVQQIRIGASEVVLRDHLPAIARGLRKQFSKLKLVLREDYQAGLETLLQKQEIDVAVTLVDRRPPAGIHSKVLLKLPLILLVHRHCALKSAEYLWKRDRIEEPLICLSGDAVMCKNFQQGLQKLGLDWFPSIEVSSLDLIETYVAGGFGIGLSLDIPKAKLPADVRALPLPKFSPVELGVLWRGKLSPVHQAFVAEVEERAKELGG